MAVSQTDRMGIYQWDSGGDPFTREQMDVSHGNIESRAAGYNQAGSRPVASASYEGFFHFSGSGVLSYCDGTVWTDVGTLASSSGEIGIIDGTASAGVASSAAKADHKHAIAAGTITETMLDTASVTESKLGSASVTEVKIDALAVTNAKLAADAVTGDKIDSTTTITAATFSGNQSGGSVAATTLTASGDANFNSGTLFVDVSANRVGILNTTPSYPLDVTGNARVTGSLRVGSTTTDSNILFYDTGSSTDRTFQWDDSFNGWRVEDNNGTMRTLWHSGNDGTGSGLDADTLDGVEGANYLRSNTSDTLSGDLTVTGTINGDLSGNAATVTVGTSSTNASYRVPFFTSSSGSLSPKTDAGLTYNPSTNTLFVTGEIYLGADTTGDSIMRFYDDNSNAWRSLYWDDSNNDWFVTDNGGSGRAMWHAGNLNFTNPAGVVSTSDALRSSVAANNSVPAIQCGGGSNDDYGIGKSSGFTTLRFFSNGSAIFLASESAFYPTDDNVKNLGLSSGSFRFDNIYATSGTVNTSDERDKTEIADLDLGLDFVNDLRPVSFKWNDRSGYVGTRTHQGFLAQQVKSVLDSYGVDRGMFVHDVPDGEPVGSDENDNLIYGEDRMSLRAHEILPSVVLAIQELTARVEALEP